MSEKLFYFNKYWKIVNNLEKQPVQKIYDLGMKLVDPSVFKLPSLILEKLHESIREGDYALYSPPRGDPKVLKEILEYENSLLNSTKGYKEKEITLTPGAIAAYSLILDLIAGKKDEFLCFKPTFFSLSVLSDLKAQLKESEKPFTASNLKEELTSSTKAVFLCQPNNPTGLYHSPTELEKVIELTRKKGIYLILDESCGVYVYNKKNLPRNIFSDNVVRIKSFSKSLNLPGFRLGYILADEKLLQKLIPQIPVMYGNPTTMLNRALLTEFKVRNEKLKDKEYQQTKKKNLEKMKQNKEIAYAAFNHSEFVDKVIKPEASFHLFVKAKYREESFKLFKELLNKKLVIVSPGIIFGMPLEEPWFRVCFAREEDYLREGIKRILEFLGENQHNQKIYN